MAFRTRRRLGLVLPALLIGACAVSPARVPPSPVEPPAPLPPAEAPTDPGDNEAVRVLLEAGARALAEDRLLTPEDDNAYLYYRKALALAPDDPDVGDGLERIVERYIVLARSAIEREQWVRARSMLARAAIVDREHPGIRSMREQLALLENAERLILPLVQKNVREHGVDAANELAAFGRHARNPNARVSIRAASDTDARWIYEQLNRAPGERRIRSAIQIGLPPRVTIMLVAPLEN